MSVVKLANSECKGLPRNTLRAIRANEPWFTGTAARATVSAASITGAVAAADNIRLAACLKSGARTLATIRTKVSEAWKA